MKQLPVQYSAALSISLGLIVMFGWLIESTLLVQGHPKFAPMQFNTALGFLLAGAILFSLHRKKIPVAFTLSILLFLLSTTTLSQYIMDWNLGIDEFFMTHSITTKTSHRGRMSPPTGVCFLLISIGAFTGALAAEHKTNYSWTSLCVSTCFTFAAIAFFGYLFDLEDLYGWKHLTRMAVHTSLGFIVIAFGFFSWLRVYDNSNSLELQREPQIILALGLTLSLILWRSNITIKDKTWFIELNPPQSWVDKNVSGLPAISSLIVFILTALFAILLYFVLLSRQQKNKILVSNNQLQDIKNQLEERVKIRTAELEEKNSELERFTYTVSHDLKSPLVTIKGFLGMLEEDLRKEDKIQLKEDMSFIFTAVNQMQTLLNDLLELSRVGQIQESYELINTKDLLEEVQRLLATPLLNKKVQLSVAEQLPTVVGNRQRLLEVFQNLIENATKFMGDQKSPIIEVGVNEGEPTTFFVRDNGIGIDSKYHEKIFGLFERLSNDNNGTGIGLALVKRIVEKHDGRIWVESEGLGRGTCFFFTVNKKLKGSDE